MSKPDLCHLCASLPAVTTVTRRVPDVPSKLPLCKRCLDVFEAIAQTISLESRSAVLPCCYCRRPSEAIFEKKDSQGGLPQGRFAVCQHCVENRQGFGDVLNSLTLWSPGVLELPPAAVRFLVSPPTASGDSTNIPRKNEPRAKQIRALHTGPTKETLVLLEDGQQSVYNLRQAASVRRLFSRLGFPQGGSGSGIQISELERGPLVVLHRIYEQKMPGQVRPGKLVCCCEVRADRDADPPAMLTLQEAYIKFGINPA